MSEVIHLADGGSRASILVTQGFNCFSFHADTGDAVVDVIWAEPDHAGGQCRPSGGGTPLLFPFPGRLAGAQLAWEGRQYSLSGDDGRGNAIHGFAFNRPWRLIDQSATEAVAQFQLSKDGSEAVDQWPSDFVIEARYRVQGSSLRCDVAATNVGDRPMPAGFGAHPYFQLPAGEDTSVRLPVTKHWELVEMLPTGNCRDVADAEQVQQGRPMSALQLDDAFGGLVFDDEGVCRASLRGPQATIELTFGQPFREIVVYTPGHRESICIEPYSCVPGDVALGESAGWTPMAPGERRAYWFEISARTHS